MAKNNQNDVRQKISLAPVKSLAPSSDKSAMPLTEVARPAPSVQAKAAHPERDTPPAPKAIPEQVAPVKQVAATPAATPSPQAPAAIHGETGLKVPNAPPPTTRPTAPADNGARKLEIPIAGRSAAEAPASQGTAPKQIPATQPAAPTKSAKATAAKSGENRKAVAERDGQQVSKAPVPVAKAAKQASAPKSTSRALQANVMPSVSKQDKPGAVAGNGGVKSPDTSTVMNTDRARGSVAKLETTVLQETSKPQPSAGSKVLELKAVDRRPAATFEPVAVASLVTSADPGPLPVAPIALALPGVTEATATILFAPALRAVRVYAEAQSQILDHLLQEFSATLAEAEAFAKAKSPSEVVMLQGQALRRRFESGTANVSDIAQIASKLGTAA